MTNGSPIIKTGISCVTDRIWSLSVFCQLSNGKVDQSKHLDGVWTNANLDVTPTAATPFASVTYSDGKDIRLYYLDESRVVQEFCFSSGRWFLGEVGEMNARVAPGSGLAAVVYGDSQGGVHLRVYYQEDGSNRIKELANDGHWHAGELNLAGALSGTNLAAVAYDFQSQTQTRLYYQAAADLSLKEHGHNNSGWFAGEFHAIGVAPQSPISAVVYGNVVLQVFYRTTDESVVSVKNTGSWGGPVVVDGLGPGYNFAVLQWEDGKRFRIYYQDLQNTVAELCSDDGGRSWFPGELRLK